MSNPNSFPGGSAEADRDSESLREINIERGDKVNDIEIANRRREELMAKLKSAGYTLEEVPAKAPESAKSPEPAKTPEPAPTPRISTAPEKVSRPEASPSVVANKAKKNPAFKKAIRNAVIGVVATIGVASAIGGIAHGLNSANAATVGGGPVGSKPAVMTTVETTTPTPAMETVKNQFAGEMPNGLSYDYTEYADREHKEAYNAYGYDYSKQYDNREESTKGIISMAEREPEALASYAYNIFTAEEKKELGIDGLTMVEIDNKFSSDEAGGDLQKKTLNKLDQVLKDKETNFKFYHENGTEETNYVYFVDANKDGNYTPDELHLGYDTKKRNNAPQVDIYRTIKNADGTTKTIKMLDLNMQCGYQPNYEKAPAGVPKIEANKPVSAQNIVFGGGASTTPTPTPTPPNPEKPKRPTPTPPPPDKPPTPTPPPPDKPKPEEKIKPKDEDNLKRIDENINKDIAEDINTDKVVVKPNPGVSPEDITEKPSSDDYEGTEPTIEQNDSSKSAEDVQPNISQENDYSQDLGGANEGNAADHPVEDNQSGQDEADSNEMSQEDAPTSGDDLKDALSDLGIK